MVKAEWSIANHLYAIDCDKNNTVKANDVVTDKQRITSVQFAEIFGQTRQFQNLAQPVPNAL